MSDAPATVVDMTDFLQRMREGWTEDRWYKGDYCDPQEPSRVCIVGRIVEISKRDNITTQGDPTDVLGEYVPRGYSLSEYNDHPNTTWDDIQRVLTQAIEAV